MTSTWLPRFPDLAGKAVVLASESSVAVEVARLLAANQALVALVTPSRAQAETVNEIAAAAGPPAVGFTADPGDPQTWARVGPHIEQRLGPIDVVIAVATEPTRSCAIDALVPDMAARGRGVVVEVGSQVTPRQPPSGIRYRAVQGGSDVTAADVAAAAVACASDSFAAAAMTITLAGTP